MTRMVLALIVLALAGLAQPRWAAADVLLIEEVRQAERMELPPNGMKMDEVRAKYGEPKTEHAAVGNPPITRWDYDRWSVYFEYNLVLYTVLHKDQVIAKKKD